MSGKQVVKYLGASLCAAAFAGPAAAALEFDQNVTSNVIYGTGNTNGSWTVDRGFSVELGLRAHVRHDLANDLPANVFNSSGDGTYTHAAGSPAADPTHARWNFDFSINSNHDNLGTNLGALTYLLQIDVDPSQGTNFGGSSFDPLHVLFADHSFGNNSTAESAGAEAADAAGYANLLANNNLAQNSWNMAFFPYLFDSSADATYTFVLSAFRSSTLLAQSTIDVVVGAGGTAVPVPATLALLLPGLLALGWQTRRKLA